MKKTVSNTLIIIGLLSAINMTSCDAQPPAYNVNTFSNKYRDLAIAITSEAVEQIEKIERDNLLDINYKDPQYGISLLQWAIYNRKYNSCKKLLELGANPNQKDILKQNVPAIIFAANIDETSSFLRLLLEFGGNPNIVSDNIDSMEYTEYTPLIAAAASRLESVKLLVDKGANVNFSPRKEFLPLTVALMLYKIDIAKFLIFERQADIHKVYFTTIDKDTLRIENLLRLNVFPLDSKEYKDKMEIVAYLKQLGIDYTKAPIPEFYYKNYTKEFLDKY